MHKDSVELMLMRKEWGRGVVEEPVTRRNKRVRQTSWGGGQIDILTNCWAFLC